MKVVTSLITGAGSGIGLSIAKRFYLENHNLILLVRTLKQKKVLEKNFKSKKVKIFYGNLANYEFIKKISKKIGSVNNLINNAGDQIVDHLINVKKKDLDYLIDINFKSTFLLTQNFTKKMIMKKMKGSVINLSSTLGQIGSYNRSVYCASKFAVEGFTKAAALDLGKFGIRVNSIAPCKTITNEKDLLDKARIKSIKKKIPLGEFTKKEDIAELCLFLTSNASKNITGSTFKIDGGWTAGK